jgi:hypothetical protein
VFRNKRGIFGAIALAGDVEDRTAALDGEFRFVAADHQLTMTLSLADWEMAKLQAHRSSLARWVCGCRSAARGARHGYDERRARRCPRRSDRRHGSLVAPELPGGAVPIAGAKISASYDRNPPD